VAVEDKVPSIGGNDAALCRSTRALGSVFALVTRVPAAVGVVTVLAAVIVGLLVLPPKDSYSHKVAALPRTAELCQARGGKWFEFGNSGNFYCNLPTSDAWRGCDTSEECQGVCLAAHSDRNEADANRCSPAVLVFGCYEQIAHNGRETTCYD